MKCQCCSSEMLVIGEFNGYAHARCGSCQFEHFFAPENGISSEMYEQDQDYQDDLALAENPRSLVQWAHRRALLTLREMASSVPAQVRVLDVGCFNGFFVKELLTRGYDAYGVDFNADAIAFGEVNYDLKGRLSRKMLHEVEGAGQRFDVVTMFEVVEHLPEVRTLLDLVSGVLRPGGLLVLSTPNSKMCWRPPLDFPPHHLSRFAPQSLGALLESAGFVVVRTYEQMSLYDLLRHRTGLLFRRAGGSLRGGSFRSHRASIGLRRFANGLRWAANVMLAPFDLVAYMLGYRYISQVVVARL